MREDLNVSLKSGAKERAGVLRLLLAELYNKKKEKQGTGKEPVLNDDETMAVLQKEAKKRRESIDLFKKGQREDLVKKEEGELAIIGEYLPKTMEPEEIKAVINALFEKGLKDFNSLMKEAMKELKGRADGKLVGEIIKEKLK